MGGMLTVVSDRPEPSLQHLPVTVFSSVMGIGGLSLAWRRATHVWDFPVWPSQLLFWIALTVFVVIGAAYAAKTMRYPAAVGSELRHPIRMAFAPTITISLLILATAGSDLMTPVARVAWWVGGVAHLAATVLVVTEWVGREDIMLTQVTPAWFIPVVGNVVTPLGASSIGSVEFGWIAFGIGIVFWLALLPLLLYRLLLHEHPLPSKLLPTLAIFIAPPAVAMLSWQQLTGNHGDPASRILFAAALMFIALLLAQFARLRTIPFALPYWAYTFPMAAGTAAAIASAGDLPSIGYDVVAIVLLSVTTLLVVVVSALTLRAAGRGEICVPE